MATELRAFYLELIQAMGGTAMAKQDRQGCSIWKRQIFMQFKKNTRLDTGKGTLCSVVSCEYRMTS